MNIKARLLPLVERNAVGTPPRASCMQGDTETGLKLLRTWKTMKQRVIMETRALPICDIQRCFLLDISSLVALINHVHVVLTETLF